MISFTLLPTHSGMGKTTLLTAFFQDHYRGPVSGWWRQARALTRAASTMALSNSRYASQTASPLVMCNPTDERALSKTERTFSRPPFWPIPPTEYWPYSSQMLGPKYEKYIQDRKCSNVKTFVLTQTEEMSPLKKCSFMEKENSVTDRHPRFPLSTLQPEKKVYLTSLQSVISETWLCKQYMPAGNL